MASNAALAVNTPRMYRSHRCSLGHQPPLAPSKEIRQPGPASFETRGVANLFVRGWLVPSASRGTSSFSEASRCALNGPQALQQRSVALRSDRGCPPSASNRGDCSGFRSGSMRWRERLAE
jgi:hypothetical protein